VLRLRGDDRVAIITAPLSMTVVIGLVPQRLKPESILGRWRHPSASLRAGSGSRALPGLALVGSRLGDGKLHRSFVGSRSRCVRLRFLRMTGAEVPQTQGEVPSAAEAGINFGALTARLEAVPFPVLDQPAAELG
jgi:hypothetical protein